MYVGLNDVDELQLHLKKSITPSTSITRFILIVIKGTISKSLHVRTNPLMYINAHASQLYRRRVVLQLTQPHAVGAVWLREFELFTAPWKSCSVVVVVLLFIRSQFLCVCFFFVNYKTIHLAIFYAAAMAATAAACVREFGCNHCAQEHICSMQQQPPSCAATEFTSTRQRQRTFPHGRPCGISNSISVGMQQRAAQAQFRSTQMRSYAPHSRRYSHMCVCL